MAECNRKVDEWCGLSRPAKVVVRMVANDVQGGCVNPELAAAGSLESGATKRDVPEF